MNKSMVRALMARGLVAAVAVTLVGVGVVPSVATAAPLAAAAAAADGLESSPEAKVRAAAVVGVVAPDSWLVLNDRDFVFELWKAATGAEVRASAELALSAGTPAGCEACTLYIEAGIHEAQDRDIANEVRDAELARAAREAKQRAAATIGIVATPEMLVLSARDFVYEIWRVATGPKVKAAALAAFGGTAEQQSAFIATGIRAAHEQDQADAIEADQQRTEEEKARLAARDAKARAAAVLGILASDGMLAMSDDNFIRAIWDASTDGTELQAAAISALRSADPARWKAFIDTGIHEANQLDIEAALQKQAEADRKATQLIVTRAEAAANRNLALAARDALTGTPDAISLFLRTGQYQVRPDLPDMLQVAHSGQCLAIGSASTAINAESLQWPCSGNADQRWTVLPKADGHIQLRNGVSKLCLGILGDSLQTGAKAVQYTCTGSDNQLWLPENTANGVNQLRDKHSKLCLAIGSASQTNGARAIQWTCNGGADQAWAVRTRGLVNFEAGHFNRDAYSDMLAIEIPTGKLLLYPGTATGGTVGAPQQIGAGWNTMDKLAVGRVNGDEYDDLLAVKKATGQLVAYYGTAAGGHFNEGVVIGNSGWNSMEKLVTGDFNRDAYGDLIAVQKETGKLYLYPGTAAGGAHGARVEIGSGWNSMQKLTVGRFNRDGYDDLFAVKKETGQLVAYYGTAAGGRFNEGVIVGTGGWNGMTELTTGRFNRDEYDDIATVRDANSLLFVYPGTAAGGAPGTRFEIGIGG